MPPLQRLNYQLPGHLPLDKLRRLAKPYVDKRNPGRIHTEWLQLRLMTLHPVIQQTMLDLGILSAQPILYWQAPGYVLPPHTDLGTRCAVNFVLSDDPAPVTFDGQDFYYRQALLDTSRQHSVNNGSVERVLLKFAIADRSFADVLASIPAQYLEPGD